MFDKGWPTWLSTTMNPTIPTWMKIWIFVKWGSHSSQVLGPSHMRPIHAISAVESMEVGTYHFTRVPSHMRSIRAISTVERMKVGIYHFTWGQSMQSQPSRTWKLGLTTSHGSQVLSPKSHEVNPCNLNRQEHGSWDLPLHTGPKS